MREPHVKVFMNGELLIIGEHFAQKQAHVSFFTIPPVGKVVLVKNEITQQMLQYPCDGVQFNFKDSF